MKNIERVPKLVTIIGSVCACVGFLFLVVITVFCIRKMWKSRPPNMQSNQEIVDANPVYGVYGDVYEETEIYDRNAYYASSDSDAEETVTTMIRDNNPDYE